jgi:LysM repeat protein
MALAWSILLMPLLAVAGLAPSHLAQATTSTAFNTQAPLASRPGAIAEDLADTPDVPRSAPASAPGTAQASPASAPGSRTPATAGGPTAVTLVTAIRADSTASPASGPATWTVQPGDTLSAIAAALAVPGGWPALYTANQQAVGPDPDVIRPGTVLTLPGRGQPARYTVSPSDTLSAIAAALAVPGGWPALYTANRQVVGPDPDVIRPGTVLTVPRLAPRPAPRQPAPGQAAPVTPGPTPAPGHHPPSSRPAAPPAVAPVPAGAAHPGGPTPAAKANASGGLTTAGGMPAWLEDVLLAAGLLAATAFAAEPAAAFARRRQAAAPTRPAAPRAPGRAVRRAAARARIILADYDRLIVTYCAEDHTVYVLTPPGEDPRAVLRAARLVLPEDTYLDLAGHLGVPSAWPRE